MSLIVITVLLAIALVVSLAANMGFFGSQKPPARVASGTDSAPRTERRDDDGAARAGKLESELDKKRKELDEVKRAQAELRDELKATKKKVHDQREADKTGDDLAKARAEVERQASIQLESTRQELANALADVQRLKGLVDQKARKPQEPREEKPREEKREEPRAQEEKREVVVQRVIRELSDAEKEKMNRLEQQASSDKKKAIELAAELRNVKARIDREKREARRVYEEGRLARDKFRAVELRLNRTLLESDLLKRAIFDLEKKTGTKAEKTSLSSDELAASDATMREKHAAEDKANDDARAKLEAAEATTLEEAPPPSTGPVSEPAVVAESTAAPTVAPAASAPTETPAAAAPIAAVAEAPVTTPPSA
jgi:chromosome segregation ATPase